MNAIDSYHPPAEALEFVEIPTGDPLPPRPDNIDYASILAAFGRRIGLFFSIFGGCIGLVILFLMVYPPHYTGTARITIMSRTLATTPERQTPLISQLPLQGADVDTEVQIIQSRRVVQRVIDELRLDQDPEFNSPKKGMLGKTLSYMLNFFAPVKAVSKKDEIIDAVILGLDPERYLETNAIDINYRDTSAAKAQKIANAFAKAYLEDQVEAKLNASRQAALSVSLQIERMRQQADSDSIKVQQYKVAHNLLSVGLQSMTEQQVTTYQQSIASAKADLAAELANLHTAQEQLAQGSTGDDVGEALSSPVVTALRAQRAVVSGKLADLEGHYGPKYPDIAQTRRQLADIDTQIEQEIRRTISNLSAKAAASQKRLDAMQGTLAASQNSLAGNNAAQAGLDNLTRAATVSQQIYLAYLERAKENVAQLSGVLPDAEIVSYSDLPEQPSMPVLWLFLLLGLVAGVLFGALGVLLAELNDTSLASGEDVERRLGRRYLGAVPNLPAAFRGGSSRGALDALTRDPFSPYAEALRALRAAISLAFPGPPPVVILVTSSLPREGVTSIALGLARTSAMMGVSTVLVDGDVRGEGLSRALGVKGSGPGLLEVLSGEAPLAKALRTDAASGVLILPMGQVKRPVDELVGGVAMDELLADLRGRAQVIIIDTAPVLPIAVTRILAMKADAVVLVTRWRKTPEAAVRSAIRLLPRGQIRFAGVALSRVSARSQAEFRAAPSVGLFRRLEAKGG
jgi:uncharacterized protein involved in exopolysaccharide biosynthesis/Mrp family chromosome partitioning ATPase